MRRLRATLLNAAGRVAFDVGKALHDFDAGYWNRRPPPSFNAGTTRK